METREANVQFPHWLIIGGALLVFVGLIGVALRKRQTAADPVSFEQDRVTGQQSISLPNFLGSRGSRDPSPNGGSRQKSGRLRCFGDFVAVFSRIA